MKHNLSRTSFIPCPGVLSTPNSSYLSEFCEVLFKSIVWLQNSTLSGNHPSSPAIWPPKFRFIAGVKVIRGMIKSCRLNMRKHLTKTPLTCNLVNEADRHPCGENSQSFQNCFIIISDLNGKLNQQKQSQKSVKL